MKEMWTEPRIEVQKFAANEYVAACGDSGVTYYFKCDAGEPYQYGSMLGIPLIDDHPYKVTTDEGRVLTRSYGPCDETHVAESDSGFLHGYIDNTYTEEDEHIEVVIWTEYGRNVHCTTQLNMNEWVTAKS